MKFLSVGIVVAIIAWILNRYLIEEAGTYGLVVITPIMEEFLKTYGAYIFSTDILLVHVTFGTIEAVDDIKRGARSISAGIVSFIGHLLFGSIASYLYNYSNIVWSLLGSSIAHILWNLFVVFLVNIKRS